MSIAARQLLAHRYFFALKPDEVTARRTYAFAERDLSGVRLIDHERHHVTLAITEDFEEPHEAIVAALLRAGAAVAAEPFELELDRLSASRRSVALRPSRAVPALNQLQAQIVRAMVDEGVPLREDWRFSPHETLGYRDGEPFARRLPAFRWHVGEFVLVHSYVGLTRHETLGRWPLKAERDPQLTLLEF